MQIVIPCPSVAFIVPVGWFHEFTGRRSDLIRLTMISYLKLVGLYVVDKLVNVVVRIFIFIAIITFNYFLKFLNIYLD